MHYSFTIPPTMFLTAAKLRHISKQIQSIPSMSMAEPSWKGKRRSDIAAVII